VVAAGVRGGRGGGGAGGRRRKRRGGGAIGRRRAWRPRRSIAGEGSEISGPGVLGLLGLSLGRAGLRFSSHFAFLFFELSIASMDGFTHSLKTPDR
jgi:hypothetical protein